MSEVVIQLDDETISRLTERARHHGRSFEDEARALLESFAPAATMGEEAAEERADALRRPLAGDFATSVAIIRRHRDGGPPACCSDD